MDPCGDPKPLEPKSDHHEIHNRRRMEICPREVDAFQNAMDESLRRAEVNQYQNKVNRENRLLIPSVVSRKNET